MMAKSKAAKKTPAKAGPKKAAPKKKVAKKAPTKTGAKKAAPKKKTVKKAPTKKAAKKKKALPKNIQAVQSERKRVKGSIPKAQLTERDKAHFEHLKKWIPANNRKFMKANPNATLTDLMAHLEIAAGECQQFGDELINEHDSNELGKELRFELGQYDQGDVPNDEYTFEFRSANIEENLEEVQELAEALGGDTKLKDVSKR